MANQNCQSCQRRLEANAMIERAWHVASSWAEVLRIYQRVCLQTWASSQAVSYLQKALWWRWFTPVQRVNQLRISLVFKSFEVLLLVLPLAAVLSHSLLVSHRICLKMVFHVFFPFLSILITLPSLWHKQIFHLAQQRCGATVEPLLCSLCIEAQKLVLNGLVKWYFFIKL